MNKYRKVKQKICFIIIFSIILSYFSFIKISQAQAEDYAACNEIALLDGWNQIKSQTLTKEAGPYCVFHDLYLPAEQTLTIKPGTVIKFGPLYSPWGRVKGVGINFQGRLYINGTADEPVVFTSIFDDEYGGDSNEDGDLTQPTPGSWGVLNFENQEKIIKHAVFQYGGYYRSNKMLNIGTDFHFELTDSVITQSGEDGIHLSSSLTKFEYNQIYNNLGHGLVNYSVQQELMIDIRKNYWGSDSGPYIQGLNENIDSQAESVSSFFQNTKQNFIFEPWLTKADLEKTSIPEWRQQIQLGDILYDPYSAGVGHIAMYVGNNKTIEAQGDIHYPFNPEISKVRENDISSWDYPKRKNVYLLRVIKPAGLSNELWQQKINNAVGFVKDQYLNIKVYDWMWLNKSVDADSFSWYCSELIWAAYYNQGVNLDYSDRFYNTISPVAPIEIYLDDDTYEVASHIETEFGTLRDYILFMVMSPVDVVITDPEGNTLSKDGVHIAGATFVPDYIDPLTGQTYDLISLPNIAGSYKITVTPKADALPADIFSLKAIIDGQESWLAQDVKISDIPEEPYFLSGTAGGFKNQIQNNNNITAAVLDFSAQINDISPQLTPLEKASTTLQIINQGTVDFQYELKMDNFSGDLNLCSDANLKLYADEQLFYDGELAAFNIATSTLTTTTVQSLFFDFELENDSLSLQNKNCLFDLKLIAWQTNSSDASQGFSQEQTLNLNLESGQWQTLADHLLINEVQINEQEFIELYNPTTQDINLSGFYWAYYSSNRTSWSNPYRQVEFPSQAVVKAHDYYLIALYGFSEQEVDWQPYQSKNLNDSAGSTAIFSCQPATSTLVDAVGWGETYLKENMAADVPAESQSIVRLELGLDSDNNYADFEINLEPSPQASFSGEDDESGSSLKINEFLANPAGADSASMPQGEWLELYNLGQEKVELAGFYFKDESGNTLSIEECHTQEATTTIEALSYLVIYKKVGEDCTSSFSLNNNGDSIGLYDGNNQLIDAVVYNSSTDSLSWARLPDGSDNWQETASTPGSQNQ